MAQQSLRVVAAIISDSHVERSVALFIHLVDGVAVSDSEADGVHQNITDPALGSNVVQKHTSVVEELFLAQQILVNAVGRRVVNALEYALKVVGRQRVRACFLQSEPRHIVLCSLLGLVAVLKCAWASRSGIQRWSDRIHDV